MAAIFDFPLIFRSDKVPFCSTMFPDLENMSITVGISWLCCAYAKLHVLTF